MVHMKWKKTLTDLVEEIIHQEGLSSWRGTTVTPVVVFIWSRIKKTTVDKMSRREYTFLLEGSLSPWQSSFGPSCPLRWIVSLGFLSGGLGTGQFHLTSKNEEYFSLFETLHDLWDTLQNVRDFWDLQWPNWPLRHPSTMEDIRGVIFWLTGIPHGTKLSTRNS